MAVAGCASTEQAAPLALAADAKPASETPPETPGAWATLLHGHGIDTSIPSQGKFILVDIPCFELVALRDGVPVLRSRVVAGRPATVYLHDTNERALFDRAERAPSHGCIRVERTRALA